MTFKGRLPTRWGLSSPLSMEDCGQLEALANGEDQYPVTFPCILIGVPETKWETLNAATQQGNSS